MLIKNVITTEKKGKIYGDTFHVFYLGVEAVLYDELFDTPIIYGNKNIVKNTLKNFKKYLPSYIRNITIYYYQPSTNGLIKRFKFTGPLDKVITPNF